jgi:hypothetical protein
MRPVKKHNVLNQLNYNAVVSRGSADYRAIIVGV